MVSHLEGLRQLDAVERREVLVGEVEGRRRRRRRSGRGRGRRSDEAWVERRRRRRGSRSIAVRRHRIGFRLCFLSLPCSKKQSWCLGDATRVLRWRWRCREGSGERERERVQKGNEKEKCRINNRKKQNSVHKRRVCGRVGEHISSPSNQSRSPTSLVSEALGGSRALLLLTSPDRHRCSLAKMSKRGQQRREYR